MQYFNENKYSYIPYIPFERVWTQDLYVITTACGLKVLKNGEKKTFENFGKKGGGWVVESREKKLN